MVALWRIRTLFGDLVTMGRSIFPDARKCIESASECSEVGYISLYGVVLLPSSLHTRYDEEWWMKAMRLKAGGVRRADRKNSTIGLAAKSQPNTMPVPI